MFWYIIQEERSEIDLTTWFSQQTNSRRAVTSIVMQQNNKTHNAFSMAPLEGVTKAGSCPGVPLWAGCATQLRPQAEPGAAPELDLSLKPAQSARGMEQHQPCPGAKGAGRISAPLTHRTEQPPTTNSNIFPIGMKICTEKSKNYWPEHDLIVKSYE